MVQERAEEPIQPALAHAAMRPEFEARRHIVIVGAGFGGLAAAQELADGQDDVTLIDRANHHLFQPLLYQVATAALSPGEIAQPIRSIFAGKHNVRVLLAELVSVDTAGRSVRLKDGSWLNYDVLILSTGSTHSYFGRDEWTEFAPGLKRMEDAVSVREQILLALERAECASDPGARQREMTIAVIGGRPTGVELAGSIAELAHRTLRKNFRSIDTSQVRVILFEAGPRLLGQFSEDLAAYTTRALDRLGVDIRVGAKVEDITEDGLQVGGQVIRAATKIWTAGVKATPVAEWLGVQADRTGRVTVNDDLSVPSCAGVYLLGDAALFPTPDGRGLPGLAQVAQQQGEWLGKRLRKRVSDRKPFVYRSRGNLATIGRNAAVAQFDSIRLKGFFAWLIWCVAHVILLIGFENRVLVTTRWIWAYFTEQRGARLISETRSRAALGPSA